MDRQEIIAAIEPIIRDLFDEYEGPVNDALSARDVAQWDSLANVQLMVMVEKKFGFKFKTGEIAGLANLGELVELVFAKKTA